MSRFEKLNTLIELFGSNNVLVELVRLMTEEDFNTLYNLICKTWNLQK